MLWLKMFTILYLFVTFGYCLDVIPERPEVEYFNPKYIREMKLQIRRANRTSPYYIDFFLITLDGVGNNLTVSMKVLEELSGRYQPTPIEMDYKLCDFLYKEPFLGQMYAKQLPANWTCPFPAVSVIKKDDSVLESRLLSMDIVITRAMPEDLGGSVILTPRFVRQPQNPHDNQGTHHFKNLVLHLENFPFNIPFTWASYFVTTRVDIRGFRTDNKETIFSLKCYVKVFQKPKKAG